MSDSINYDADNGSPLDGELNTPMPATQLFRGDGNNSTQQIAAPSINTVTPRERSSSTPPGLAAFKKCQTTNPHLGDMAVSLLLIAKESGVCCLPKGSRCTNQWNDLMATAFYGAKINNGQRDGNGVFRCYSPWTCANPAITKFKPLVIAIIKEFDKAFTSREDQSNATALEVVANELTRDMDKAEKEKVERADQVLAQKLQNETSEQCLGFSSPGVGVRPASGVGMRPEEQHGLSLLGQATASIGTIPTGHGKYRRV